MKETSNCLPHPFIFLSHGSYFLHIPLHFEERFLHFYLAFGKMYRWGNSDGFSSPHGASLIVKVTVPWGVLLAKVRGRKSLNQSPTCVCMLKHESRVQGKCITNKAIPTRTTSFSKEKGAALGRTRTHDTHRVLFLVSYQQAGL